MARPRSLVQRTVRQLVQQQRDGLYAEGHQNLNMALPESVIEQLDAWKRRYRFRSRDAVVARVIEQCLSTTDPADLVQRASPADTVLRRISPIVPRALATYMKCVQSRFRNLAYGPVFEMMIDRLDGELAVPDQAAIGMKRFSARKHELGSTAAPVAPAPRAVEPLDSRLAGGRA